MSLEVTLEDDLHGFNYTLMRMYQKRRVKLHLWMVSNLLVNQILTRENI